MTNSGQVARLSAKQWYAVIFTYSAITRQGPTSTRTSATQLHRRTTRTKAAVIRCDAAAAQYAVANGSFYTFISYYRRSFHSDQLSWPAQVQQSRSSKRQRVLSDRQRIRVLFEPGLVATHRQRVGRSTSVLPAAVAVHSRLPRGSHGW